MAIGRISGAMLKANLERLGTDLAFETDLLYLDVTNDRIGVNTSSPTQSLQVDNVTINNSQIRSTSGALDLGAIADITISGGTNNYVLATDGAGTLSWKDASTISGSTTGMNTELSTPTDGSLSTDGAYLYWQTSTKVTDALDDLNEVTENIRSNTFVKSVTFTSNVVSGGAGFTATQKYIFEQEMARAECQFVMPFGPVMCAPVIYTFGTQEQKDRFLPGILSGEDFWCQGYSEPGAGSDLESLKTTADLSEDGTNYIVNGQNTWTTLTQHDEWICRL